MGLNPLFGLGSASRPRTRPQEVPCCQEGQPGDAGKKSDTKAGDPPSAKHHSENCGKSGEGSPRSSGAKLQVGFRVELVVAAKREVGQKGHAPSEERAKGAQAK